MKTTKNYYELEIISDILQQHDKDYLYTIRLHFSNRPDVTVVLNLISSKSSKLKVRF